MPHLKMSMPHLKMRPTYDGLRTLFVVGRDFVVVGRNFVAVGRNFSSGDKVLERFQVLDEVVLLIFRQPELQKLIVVIDNGAEVGETAVVIEATLRM
jgi:hypothetical protein